MSGRGYRSRAWYRANAVDEAWRRLEFAAAPVASVAPAAEPVAVPPAPVVAPRPSTVFFIADGIDRQRGDYLIHVATGWMKTPVPALRDLLRVSNWTPKHSNETFLNDGICRGLHIAERDLREWLQQYAPEHLSLIPANTK
jgi:hypothetical protein